MTTTTPVPVAAQWQTRPLSIPPWCESAYCKNALTASSLWLDCMHGFCSRNCMESHLLSESDTREDAPTAAMVALEYAEGIPVSDHPRTWRVVARMTLCWFVVQDQFGRDWDWDILERMNRQLGLLTTEADRMGAECE